MKLGKLIVIEGTDGSGKATQTRILIERLQKEGHSVATLSFPQYGKKSAGLVEEYLNGKYGPPDEVSPYAASLFYAVDRFDVARKIREALSAGQIALLDRYVDSNVGHQGGKIRDKEERTRFIEWLYQTEYEILDIPRPDAVVILHVPAEIGQELVRKKEQRNYIERGTHDSHEANLQHLKNAEASYLWLAEKYPIDHLVVECVENGQLLEPARIHEKIYQVLKTKRLI